MDFKFGQYIQRVHPNKSPLKILEKREHVHIQGLGLPIFFGYPTLIMHASNLNFRTLRDGKLTK